MKNIRPIIVLLALSLSFVIRMQAQDVTLISVGEGSSRELAIRNALVSAVEQTYGVYVSGDTHILDDELIRDEIVQIKRGNIKHYNILNEAKISDNLNSVTVEATVSSDNLLKFAKSKGAKCELAGRTFAANLALYKLNVSNGANAMNQLYNALGHIVPRMYDFKLKLGEPIVFNTDVYVPVAVDCVLNDNYDTFLEMYHSTNNSITASINSIPIQGNTTDPACSEIERYRECILRLPEIWIFGFGLKDNLGGFVIPYVLSSGVQNIPQHFFWPENGIKPYKINTKLDGSKYIYGLQPNNYIIYDDCQILKSNGIRIQKLDYAATCSTEDGSANKVLKSYVKPIEDEFSKTRARSFTGVYTIRDFDERMIDWSDGFKQQSKYNGIQHKWIDDQQKSSGKKVCTIHFCLCYKGSDVARLSDIEIVPIMED